MTSPHVEVKVRTTDNGWTADVAISGTPPQTTHIVRLSRAEYERYGKGDVEDLVRRTFDFLLARESNTSILPDFTLSTVEHYFPEFAREFRR